MATKIGIIGIGNISGIYLENITKVFNQELEIVGVCDLIRERAENAAKKYNIRKIYETMYDCFADPEVEVVLNLTRPYEHYGVSKPALEAGKHVYSEKPLGASWEEGVELVKIAEEKGLWIGGAPDTFMGAGIQTCRKAIDEGLIGDIVGVVANMTCHGHESWHPDPEFYYKYGGGPMLDMGPYYITALVNLVGGIKKVTGMTRISFPQRTITSQPFYGKVIDVEVPTTYFGVMEFDNGAIGSIFTTFDVWKAHLPIIEVYGSKGTLSVPDPNYFGGPVVLHLPGEPPKELPLAFGYSENSRGLGLAEFCAAIRKNRRPRASYHQTLHVLEVMTSFQRSYESGKTIELTTKFEREAPMRADLPKGVMD
ncbi:MAG TPA: Gfo/Idh/MocA family oxidoreductase [Bacillota bacterium]|nr:Gfo/Idh/MocA family oxidoreductase [Clostridiales bacterium]HPT85089.1 Gfo/Idh/MocA family oxidoreductase [Bacillota bacterium]